MLSEVFVPPSNVTILPRTSSFAVLGQVLYWVVYVIAVKRSSWEVSGACERVQCRGEEEAADMAMHSAD